MAPVDVLFTTVFGERLGGSEHILWTILSRRDPERLRPFVVFHRDGPLAAEVAGLGIGVEVVPTGRFREPLAAGRAVRRMAALMRARRPQVVVHWLARAQVYGSPAAALAGLRDRSVWFQRQQPDPRDPLDRWATRLPARAVGTPSATAARAQAERMRPRRETFWIPNGIELPEATGARRADGGLPEDVPVVGVVGRLQELKGQHRLLDALALLRERGVQAHGLVVGGTQHGLEPEYAQRLRTRAAQLRLAVTFCGQVGDPAAWIERCDVVVCTSDFEGFGLVLVEAMSLGVPVVAARSQGGPSEILDDGRTGVLVATPDPVDLAGGIERLLRDAPLRAAVGAAAARAARERFTADRMVRRYEEAFAALARGELPASG